jgi:hypothetical protein
VNRKSGQGCQSWMAEFAKCNKFIDEISEDKIKINE